MPLQRFSPGRRACAMSEAFEAADGGGRISSLRSVSRAHKETVMAVIAMRRKALRLSPETPGVAEEVLQQQGWREVAEAARQLHREWLNDLFVYDEAYEAAAGRPDEAFLTWLRARARDPWHVTPRAVDDVGRRYGGETANLFQHIRWPQEIAWARVLRRSRDERTAVQAALFLTEARRDPSQMFRKLTEIHFEASAGDIHYHSHPNHELSQAEILEGRGLEENWKPLFLHEAGPAFRALLRQLSPEQMKQFAAAAAREEDEERRRQALEKCLSYLERHPLSCRMTALHVAREERMTSNDIVACEEAFIEALRRGNIPLPDNETAIDQSFFEWMRHGDYKPDSPDEVEVRRRIEGLAIIDNAWMQRLPRDVRDLGAERRRLFSLWRSEVTTGRRPPPRCLATDYALYLLETSGSHP